MTEPPGYLIVGRGRWAARMHAILNGEGRRAAFLQHCRRATQEEESSYRARLQASFKASGAQIAWLCVPPGSHIPLMMEAAIEEGLHVVVEKPWLCSAEETRRITARGEARGTLLAVHYEYCQMEQVKAWRRERRPGSELLFGGRMNISRPNHLGLSALDNLGSHLFSIHEYCVPDAAIAEIDCAYEMRDERRVWLDELNRRIAEIDLLANKEPIIQRFIASVEAGVRGEDFSFGLQFALNVADRSALWAQQAGYGAEP
jgi:Oxidoreductase family, NAD-binding Rossmann fold